MGNLSDSFSQNNNLRTVRDSLTNYFTSISNEKSDDEKLKLNKNITRIFESYLFIQLNKNITRIFESYLSKSEAFINPIDSVKNIGLIKSPNDQLIIYTWNIPFNDGTHKYFGYIHYYNKRSKEYKLYALNDRSEDIKNPEFSVLSNTNWYGLLYYKIIENKYKNHYYYTLLSSDLNNILTKKKIIDVLQLDENDLPVFGAKVFSNLPRNTRIIFEYNARANMTLTFDETLKMIVYDHLSPSKPSLNGVFEFYGPDFSYDAYKFEKGRWEFKSDIDARNNRN